MHTARTLQAHVHYSVACGDCHMQTMAEDTYPPCRDSSTLVAKLRRSHRNGVLWSHSDNLVRRSWKPSCVAHTSLQTSEKRNTLHRLVHFNFCSICDRSAVSLTPSGDPQPICCRSPKPRRVGGGGRGCRDTCDWWWCELNRKRWRESFYQGRNTSGLKCSCTSLCIMQQPNHEAAEAETRDAYYHCCLRLTLKLYWSRKTRQKQKTEDWADKDGKWLIWNQNNNK